LLQDVAQEFRLAAEAKGVRLETALRGAHPFVSADIALIERALENLIDNALRYTPAQGRVTLSLGSDATHALIEVSDTGCGIPENERPYIFERFYRAANNGASSHNGAGLGLAIAKRILDLHAGTLEVDSNHPTGAVLRVRLPLAAPARA
jgi:signal transduction histidine kinase